MAISRYNYPAHINDVEFQHRKFSIYVKKTSWGQDAKSEYNKALKLLSEIEDTVVAPDATTKEMTANQKKNKQANKGKLITSITLPLPNSFTDSQSHGWTTETGILGTIGASYANTSPASLADKFVGKGKLSRMAKSVLGKSSGITIDKAIGAAASHTGFRKPLIDPGYFQNYTGSQPRDFSADWDLIPNSAEEADEIMMIVMKLKQYSSPSTAVGSGVSLLAPFFFDIEVSNPYMTSMINLDRVVIKNISIDYSADGNMQQTADGVPKHMKLSIQFTEMDMVTAEKYSTVPAKAGA